MIEVTKRKKAPSSLAKRKTWRGADVLEALFDDFLGKCYLCERHVEPEGFEVEHRIQRGWKRADEYDWYNLCVACEDCNKRRPTKDHGHNPLDPTTPESLLRLRQHWNQQLRKPDFSAVKPKDEEAAQTARELNHLHNTRKVKAHNLRNAISQHLLDVTAKERDLLAATDQAHRTKLEQDLRALLSRQAPFTAMARSFALDSSHHFFD